MKLTLFLYTAILFLPFIGRIAEINRLKSEAKAAYNAGNYTTAIQKYTYLIDSLKVDEEEVLLNLANAFFQTRDTVHAEQYYQRLQQALIPEIRSRSNQQLGVLANRKGDAGMALTYFKNALKADPTNEDARYNYELLIKMMRKKNQDPKDQDKQQNQQRDKKKDKKDQQGQDKKDQQGQDKKDQQGQNKKNQQGQNKKNQQGQNKKNQQDKQQNKGQQNPKDQQSKDKQENKGQGDRSDQQKDQDQKQQNEKGKQRQGQQQNPQRPNSQDKEMPASVSDKLKQLKMSEETAKMILEAMKNSEIQYLQQKKRNATKSKDTSKPDW